MENISKRITARRKEMGLTLGEIAAFVGVNKGTVSRWESGGIENMRCDKLEKLAAILQVSPLFIMGWKESARGHELSTAARIGNKILAASPAAQLAIDKIIKEDERSQSHDSEEESHRISERA